MNDDKTSEAGMNRSVAIRVIKGITLVLGVAIVATLALIGNALFVKDTKAPAPNPQPLNAQTPVAVPAPLADFSEIPLDQPAGSAIAAATAQGDRLYITVSGGGRADRIVVVDLVRRRVVGLVALDGGAPPQPGR